VEWCFQNNELRDLVFISQADIAARENSGHRQPAFTCRIFDVTTFTCRIFDVTTDDFMARADFLNKKVFVSSNFSICFPKIIVCFL
jgi:hypothetical protein